MTSAAFKLINLAREFSQKYTVSMYELLHQAGYEKIADQISEQDLYIELFAYPDLADDWLEYSEDKRCAGWYFKLSGSNKYLVGHLGDGGKLETEYEDKLKACAVYVKHELDVIIR